MKEWIAIIILAVTLGVHEHANAGVEAEAEVAYVVDGTQRSNESPRVAYKARVGHSATPLYVFGGYETPKFRLLGQGLGEASTATFGVGAEHHWGDFGVHLEAGWNTLDTDITERSINEMAYTVLVGNHHVGVRDIPFSGRNNDGTRDATIEVEDAMGIAIGVSYQVLKHVKVTGTYTYLKPDMYIAMWDIERRQQGRGYWEERNTYDLSSFRVGIALTF